MLTATAEPRHIATARLREEAHRISASEILRAIQLLTQAQALQPNHAEIAREIAILQLQRQNPLAAALALIKVPAALRTSAETCNVAAIALANLGLLEAAAKYFQRATQLDPTHTAARANHEQIKANIHPGQEIPAELHGLAVNLYEPIAPNYLAREWRTTNLRMHPGENGCTKINDVQGFLLGGDVLLLQDLAMSLPIGGTYVEIGSFRGLSSSIVASTLVENGNDAAKLYCIDTWQGSEELENLQIIRENRLYGDFCENIQRAGTAPYIRPIRMPSVEAAKFFPDSSVDLIFIDGDHTFAGCYSDLCAWFPKMKPDARILGHDCTPGEGVEQAVTRFSQEIGATFTIYAPPQSHYCFELHR